ncbi:MAG: phospholipid carrier-dependent glycosyltransferase [Deltaproteobacteria bacterium]|nr:MAG: phospholipid carrier-dependent glycosyltransferase [Deltaproteobacteria bacterium]
MTARAALLALALATGLLAPSLVLRGTWVPDETRYADVARAMREEAGWLTPSLAGQAYSEKPPVFFWLAAGLTAAGASLDAAPRAISIAAAIITIGLLPAIGARLGVPAPAAARAALILATTPFFLVHAQMGLLDAWLTLLVTLAIGAKAARARVAGPGRTGLALLEGVALGAALLTKGPVALLFPLGFRLGGLLSGPANAARPDRSDALALALAAALPLAWLALVWRENGAEYVAGLTIGQLELRIAGSPETPHRRPPGFLAAVAILGLMPWALFGVAWIRRLRSASSRLARDATGPLLGWFALPIALLALLPSQQPHYALPAFPAAALLLAPVTLEHAGRGAARALAVFCGSIGSAFVALGAGASVFIPDGHALSDSLRLVCGDAWFRAIAIATGGALLALCIRAGRAAAPGRTGRGAAAAGAILFGGLLLLISRIDPVLVPRDLLARPEIASAQRIYSTSSLRSALRLWTPHREIGRINETYVVELLPKDPGAVVLIWQKDVRRLRAESVGGLAGLEEIGSGFVRGYRVVALRAERAEP